MKRNYLLLTMMVVLSACGSKQTQTTGGTDTTTDTATAVVQDSVAVETPSEEVDAEFEQFFDQFTFDKFVALLKNVSQEKAKDCGLSFIYEASDEGGEEGEVGTSTEVYGWGMEKGKKMECETEIEIMYIKVVVDKETLLELDKLNFVYVLNNEDMLEKIRAQI